MEFIQIQSSAKIQIQAYQHGCLTINAETYSNSLIALSDRLILDWAVKNIHELSLSHCEIFKSLNAKIILIGTGEKLIFPPQEILAWFRCLGLGVEFMDTAAACRTFQILTAENRKVAAGLMI